MTEQIRPNGISTIVLRYCSGDHEVPAVASLIAAFYVPVLTWERALRRLESEVSVLAAVQWLHSHDVRPPGITCDAEACTMSRVHSRHEHAWLDVAARRGFLSVVCFLHNHRDIYTPVPSLAMEHAAANGHFDVVAFLVANRPGLKANKQLVTAVESGHVAIIRLLRERRGDPYWLGLWLEAGRNGRLSAIQQLWQHLISSPSKETGLSDLEAEWVQQALDVAASEGHLETVEWFYHNTQSQCSDAALATATYKGYDAVVFFIGDHATHYIDCRLALEAAAEEGHVDIFEYLLRKFPPLQPLRLSAGATQGAAGRSLKMVQILHELDLGTFTVNAMNYAARSGQLEIVQYLHIHRTEGCDARARTYAIALGHLHLLDYLCQHGLARLQREDLVRAISHHAGDNAIRILEYIFNHCVAHASGNVRSAAVSRALKKAAAYGRLDMVEFLTEHHKEGSIEVAISVADAGGFGDVVDFLKERSRQRDDH